jgi:TolB-like protein
MPLHSDNGEMPREPSPSPAAVRLELERVLRGAAFHGSVSVSRLLRYTVEAVLRGEKDNLKEYLIGLEVFDRGAGFDPGRDAIVRVQARNLREKLEIYYQTEGTKNPVRIEFPKGRYAPTFGAWAAPAVHRIAVLPFVNLSPENDSSYFCDGLTEELMHVIAGYRELRVVARTSSFEFRNTQESVQKIGRALNAELILEGSVRLAGEQLRVTARLASVAEGMQLWSKRYDRKLEDVFQIQDEIAEAIATTLQRTVASMEVLPVASEDNFDLEALKLYLKGRHFWNQRTAAGFRNALECFHQAIARDSRLSRAYAGMAETYVLMMMHNLESPRRLMPRAREAALAALGIDPSLPQAHSSLAAVHALFDWNLVLADTEWQRAIESDPGYATAFHWRAMFCDVPRGDFDCALKNIRKAEWLDPLQLPIANDIAFVLYWARRYGEAEVQCRSALELNPSFYRILILLGRIYAAQGRYSEAIEHCHGALRLMEGDAFRSQTLGTLGFAHARLGNSAEASDAAAELKCLAERSFTSPVDLAILAAGAHRLDDAIEHLAEAASQKTGWILWLGCEPLLDDLRADPRFLRLEQEILKHRC